jgi:hypothetical protein
VEEKQETQYPYYDKFLNLVSLAIYFFEENGKEVPLVESNDNGSSESGDV